MGERWEIAIRSGVLLVATVVFTAKGAFFLAGIFAVVAVVNAFSWPPRRPSQADLASAFRAYVESTCEKPSDVVDALEIFDLPDGLAEQVGELLEATECPGEKR